MSQSPSQNSPSSSPPTPNPLKRKEPSDVREDRPLTPKQEVIPPGASVAEGEYASGLIVCDVCGTRVSFRHDTTGEFTLNHWNHHRETCSSFLPQPAPVSNLPTADPVIYTPESAAEALAHPVAKRRRAKRTEDERIEYLRSDPYVAKFEAYRVLCASCDKWIRLRPNSTYCSIPWDAHRKSCLAKKINNKNVYALEERNQFFARDPDIRKFDAERVLCGLCDTWIVIPHEHARAIERWLQHRADCQKSKAASSPARFRDIHPALDPQLSAEHPGTSSSSTSPTTPTSASTKTSIPSPFISHTHTLNLGHAFPAFPLQESRRRNAEQRAATLRADTLIGAVEPNRVFCSLCQKWVQLRQDSSYCAYPWVQHRGKCLARHHRRTQKTASTNDLKHMRIHGDDGASEDEEDPESEEGVEPGVDQGRDARRPPDPQRSVVRQHHSPQQHYQQPQYHSHQRVHQHAKPRASYPSPSAGRTNGYHVHHRDRAPPAHTNGRPSSSSSARVIHGAEVNEDQEEECEMYAERGGPRRSHPSGLADLDTPRGRTHFIHSSITHLFRTTYDTTDELSVSTLLAYLNAAVPQDKHEDFDMGELVKALGSLRDGERVSFEGDVVGLLD